MLQLVQHGAALSRSGLRLQRGTDLGGVESAGQQQAVDLDRRAAGLDERFDAGLFGLEVRLAHAEHVENADLIRVRGQRQLQRFFGVGQDVAVELLDDGIAES